MKWTSKLHVSVHMAYWGSYTSFDKQMTAVTVIGDQHTFYSESRGGNLFRKLKMPSRLPDTRVHNYVGIWMANTSIYFPKLTSITPVIERAHYHGLVLSTFFGASHWLILFERILRKKTVQAPFMTWSHLGHPYVEELSCWHQPFGCKLYWKWNKTY